VGGATFATIEEGTRKGGNSRRKGNSGGRTDENDTETQQSKKEERLKRQSVLTAYKKDIW
jgi:hypothetical protein